MRFSTTSRAIAAGLVLAAGALVAPGPADAAPTEPAPAACPSLYLYGVRGTGEPAGLGSQIGPIADELATLLPGEVEARANAYPAADVDWQGGEFTEYQASVAEGVDLVQVDLAAMASDCPEADVALVGYSQGADVVRQGLVEWGDVSDQHMVLLLGDPNLDGQETTIDMVDETGASVPPWFRGLIHNAADAGLLPPVLDFPAGYGDRATSLCRVEDPVCRLLGDWDLANGPHVQYWQDAPGLAADIAAWSDGNG